MPSKSDGDILGTCRGGVLTVGTLSPSVTSQPNGWYAYHQLGPLDDRCNDYKHCRWGVLAVMYDIILCCLSWDTET